MFFGSNIPASLMSVFMPEGPKPLLLPPSMPVEGVVTTGEPPLGRLVEGVLVVVDTGLVAPLKQVNDKSYLKDSDQNIGKL